jgi:DNA invertase Pin-like site-specific DNA recombinase
MPTLGTSAAQYLRMSTDKQDYSLDNQSAAIARYAEDHGFTIVKTYSDAAKSGVILRHRAGLRQLLSDVVEGGAEFRAILVYDVSRWGRFQDVDEAAHYEYLCKSAGIPVIYCAETFSNDETLPSSMMKALKRAMAGEYSRELGVKVYAGLKRLAGIGFKQGGAAGYGLRRMLVSAQRQPKQILLKGERKSIVNDRVILVHGPAHEVQTVREMYRMFTSGRYSFRAIARELNRRGISFADGGKWEHQTVRTVLTHPKYAGFQVFGRTTQKLHQAVVQMPRSEWYLTPKAHDAIVDPSTFIQAQRVLLEKAHNRTNQQLLGDLRSLLARNGRLSLRIIDKDPSTVSPATYRQRFGSLRRAYELIGYGQPENFCAMVNERRKISALRRDLMERIQAHCPERLSITRPNYRSRDRLKIDRRITVSVLVCRSIRTGNGTLKWFVNSYPRERNLITLVARLNEGNASFRDFHVLARINRKTRFTITLNHPWLKDARLLSDLSQFCKIVESMRGSGGRMS